MEGSPLWDWVDKKVGKVRLVLIPLLDIVIVAFSASIFQAIFSLSSEIALTSAISGMLIFRLDNIIYDKKSVKSFEKDCLVCKSKRQCSDFLDKNCTMEVLETSS